MTGWWDEMPTLIERYGEADALDVAWAMDGAVDELGRWCAEHGVDAWYTKAGTLSVSAAPAQDGKWLEATEACAALGVGDRYVAMDAGRQSRPGSRSPVLRGGSFMPGAATIQPAILARGLRRAALERGVTIHEGTRVVELDGERPGWLGAIGAGSRRAPAGRAGRPVRIRTTSAAGPGEVIAGSAVVALNAWAAAWPSFGRRLVTWSSYIVLTEPIPDRLEELGWTGGEGLADARFTLHYLRTTRDGRIAIGGGGGRAGFGGRIGFDLHRRRECAASVPRPGCGTSSPRWRTCASRTRGAGRSTSPRTTCRSVASVPGRPIHYAHGYSGNGVGPSLVAGRLLAGLTARDIDVPVPFGDRLAPAALVGGRPRAFPPEPFRYLGARVVREAIVRREAAEERGERVSPVLREVTRLPRRMGYHLSPD